MGTALAVLEGVHLTATAAADRTIPAIMAASAAAQALAEADSAAVRSFGSGEVLITGPGGAYQSQTSLAGQNLEQLAELSTAGAAGNPQLLLINSQLTEYRQLIEQAHADYAAGSMQLGVVEMIYASKLMHESVLTELTELRETETRTLAGQTSSFWMSAWALMTWVLPVLGLLSLLGLALRYLSKRFKRTLNASLLVAAGLLVVLGVGTGVVTRLADERLQDALTAVTHLVDARTPEFQSIQVSNWTADRLNKQCTDNHVTCGAVRMHQPGQTQVTQATAASEQAAAARQTYGADIAILGGGPIIVLLVVFGLYPRIQEYRSRRT